MIELAVRGAFRLFMHQFLTVLVFCLTCASALANDYVVQVSADLRTFEVRACFENPPSVLHAGDDSAARYLLDAHWEGRSPRHTVQRDTLTLPPAKGSRCLVYRVDTGKAADERALRRSAFVGTDLIVTPEIWLWRAPNAGRVRFELPRGMSASVPWPRVSGSQDAWHYQLTDAPRTWAAQTAFGRLTTQNVALPGGSIQIAIADAASMTSIASITDWLRTTATSMTTVYGRFPLDQVQVLIIPGDHSSPVPWGQVLRGGAPAVHFYVARDATLEQLLEDWTAFHEFSHLFLPFVRRYEAYLSEGFASYFQNITRARSANLSELAAWTNLWRGFERGRDAGGRQTLADAARRMGRDHNYMRVYWSGAAIALEADVALRQRPNDRDGLGALLGQLNDCCRNDDEAWSGVALCAALDDISEGSLFSKLNDTLARSRQFPDIFSLLRELGVDERDGEVVLDNTAPLAQIRRAITRNAQAKTSGRAVSQ